MYTYKLISNFKERLSELFDSSPLNATDLAKELDVSKQTLSAWKCGTRSPKRPTIETIARHFGVPVDWLMGFDVPKSMDAYESEKPTPEDELDEDLINSLLDLTPDEVARVIDFVSGLKAARGASVSHSK